MSKSSIIQWLNIPRSALQVLCVCKIKPLKVSPEWQGSTEGRYLTLTWKSEGQSECFLESGSWDSVEAAEDKGPGFSRGHL